MTGIQRKRVEMEDERRSLLARIEALDAKLALLAELEADLSEPTPAVPHATTAPAAPVPSAGKPSPRPAVEAGGGKRTTMAAEDARLELVRILAGHPEGLSLTELSRRTGVAAGHVSYRLKHPWFRKTDADDRYSPWVLTEAGKDVAARDALN